MRFYSDSKLYNKNNKNVRMFQRLLYEWNIQLLWKLLDGVIYSIKLRMKPIETITMWIVIQGVIKKCRDWIWRFKWRRIMKNEVV